MAHQIHAMSTDPIPFLQDVGQRPRRPFSIQGVAGFLRTQAKLLAIMRPLLLIMVGISLLPPTSACGDNCICFAEYIECEGLSVDELPSFENYRSVQVRGLYTDGVFECAHLIGVRPDQWWQIQTLYDELCPKIVDCLEAWGAQVIASSSGPDPTPYVQHSTGPPITHSQQTPETTPKSAGAGDAAIISVVSVVSVGVILVVGFGLYKLIAHMRENHHHEHPTAPNTQRARYNRDAPEGRQVDLEMDELARHDPPFFHNPSYDAGHASSDQGAADLKQEPEPTHASAPVLTDSSTARPKSNDEGGDSTLVPTDGASGSSTPAHQTGGSLSPPRPRRPATGPHASSVPGVAETEVKRTEQQQQPTSPTPDDLDSTLVVKSELHTPKDAPSTAPLHQSTPLRRNLSTPINTSHESQLGDLVQDMLSPARERQTSDGAAANASSVQGAANNSSAVKRTPKVHAPTRSPIGLRNRDK